MVRNEKNTMININFIDQPHNILPKKLNLKTKEIDIRADSPSIQVCIYFGLEKNSIHL
jgi:hypothetical protein